MGIECLVGSAKDQPVHPGPSRSLSHRRFLSASERRHDPALQGREFMKNYLLLAAIVLLCVIPFVSRAVYLDEHIYLQIARSAQTNWFFPQDTPEIFFGITVQNFASHTHPPVGEYFLALVYLALGSFRE